MPLIFPVLSKSPMMLSEGTWKAQVRVTVSLSAVLPRMMTRLLRSFAIFMPIFSLEATRGKLSSFFLKMPFDT
ncbi:hypothetical protein D3C72_1648650 [compost metagenome]